MEQHYESAVQAINPNSSFPVPLIAKELTQIILLNKIGPSNVVQSISPDADANRSTAADADYPQEISRHENYNNLELLRNREQLRKLEDFTGMTDQTPLSIAEHRLKEQSKNLFKNLEFPSQQQKNRTNQLHSKRKVKEKDKSIMKSSSNSSSTMNTPDIQFNTGLLQGIDIHIKNLHAFLVNYF